MGFLTDEEDYSLHIEKMNFQIVGEETFTPRRAMQTVEFEDFFLARIRDMDASSVFRFKEGSRTKLALEGIARGGQQFARGAAQLASEFDSRHVGQSSSGAFFSFELSVSDPEVKLYAMLKYDYREVLAPTRAGSANQLRKIVEAFVQDKRALQKSCLVRVRNGSAEVELSAKDRNGKSPNITDFFTAFLDVERNRDDVELNREVAQAVMEVLKANKGLLPNQDIGEALGTARERLRTSASINDATVLDAVLVAAGRPQESDTTATFEAAVVRELRRRRISGLDFPPDENVLKKAVRRRVVTREGVRLDYPQSLDGIRVSTEVQQNGSATITITTEYLESNKIVPETISAIRQ